MTVIAVTASRTSPGATSLATGLALALATDYERSLLVEADPAGGVLSLRFDLDVTPSLTTFGSDTRNGYSHDLVWRNSQDLRGTRCIPAPVDPRLARSWVERVTPMLNEHLPTLGAPTVIDLGWIAEDGPSLPLAAAADITLVVTRPEIAEVQALLFQVRQLQSVGATVGLVTVGNTPNDPQEVALVAGVPLIAVLPDDAVVAAALRGAKFAPNKFRRSLLWRTIGGIAASLVDPGVLASRSALVEPPIEAPIEAPIELSAEAISQIIPPSYSELSPEVLDLTDPPIEFVDPDLFDDTSRMVTVAPAELILDTGETRSLDLFAPTFIGRHGECDIVLADSQVSRRHARLTRTAAGWHFADLGSRNGSTLNGRPCTAALLNAGDELFIGGARLVFCTTTSFTHLRETENV